MTKARKSVKTKKTVSDHEQEVIRVANAIRKSLKASENEKNKGGNLVVIARAGTGKTFTLIEGLNKIRNVPKFEGTPSSQQEAIWEAMQSGPTPLSVLFCAFNKSIQKELERKVPLGCQASTIHSLGNKLVRSRYPKPRMTKWKTPDLLEEITGMDYRELKKDKSSMVQTVQRLVGLAKLTLAGWTKECGFEAATIGKGHLDELCNQYGIEMNGDADEIYDYVPKVLELSREMETNTFDYDDMIWLPVVNDIPVAKYDLLLVDEAQDMNACQQQLIMKTGKRIIACGDPMQAIYGFAGADTESIEHLITNLTKRDSKKVEVLPLNVTFRCCKAVVNEARKIVEDYSAWEENMQGDVVYRGYDEMMRNAKDGEMILCRTNAPLVSTAFRLISNGTKATIRGNDIGKGLTMLIDKLKATDVGDLMSKVDDYYHQECQKLQKRRIPPEAQLIALKDKRDCILAFCEGCYEISDVTNSIKAMFIDDKSEGVCLSSIHRAKGLEAYKVYIMRPDLLPHPMASTPWQREQESNLKYVGITRAIERLIWVHE